MRSDRCVTGWHNLYYLVSVSRHQHLPPHLLSPVTSNCADSFTELSVALDRVIYCNFSIQFQQDEWVVPRKITINSISSITKWILWDWELTVPCWDMDWCLPLTDDIVLTAQHKHWTRLKLSRLLSPHAHTDRVLQAFPSLRSADTLWCQSYMPEIQRNDEMPFLGTSRGLIFLPFAESLFFISLQKYSIKASN